MVPTMRCIPLIPLACAMILVTLTTAQCAPDKEDEHVRVAHSVRILAVHPHDDQAFTQGLLVTNGRTYESTGQYGESTVRITDLESGTVQTMTPLPDDRFGEGLARLGDTLIQLSWKSGEGFLYDHHTLKPLGTFRYQGQGWGLAASGAGIVMSDGTAQLRFLNLKTLAAERTVTVTENGREVAQLNELEWYEGLILANVWLRDEMVAIDPADGRVVGRIDLAPLRTELPRSANVANGIGYDAESGRLYLTGKYWNKLFEVEITPPLP